MPEQNKNKGDMTMREAGHRGGERSWTSRPGQAKTPELTEQDRLREQDIRAKQQRGEELTTEEAGFLGGVERVRQAQGGRGGGRQR